ncbi:HEPN domain-containing protein [Geobacter pelophilus]|uniref:HEPN domain-containing protein n=1 Tax=Geoanaerobacter pelophilus TaxID=60036 RepID=A0AAW4L7W6_9BACT|nr:HEPN domain-containing protein [Geoanaerobacter pelophilus]MBT0664119.1 HEPN domain-containing protein [Geoanaerobacter pelophilus]
MQPLTIEWIQKAEGDLATAHRELRARTAPNYDAACFHAQQCAEKYLKALLQETEKPFGKTHNLSLLLDLLKERYPTLELIRPTLAILNAYSVEYRYPGESADKEVARKAVKLAEEAKLAVLGEMSKK